MKKNTFSGQLAPGMRSLVLDFGVYWAVQPDIGYAPRSAVLP